MKITLSELALKKKLSYQDNISFDKDKYHLLKPILDILSCTVEVEAHHLNDGASLKLKIDSELLLESSYTLKPFRKKYHLSENLELTYRQEDKDNCDLIYVKGTTYDLDQDIFDLITNSVPPSIHLDEEKLPSSGKGYNVFTEEEYFKQKAESGNNAFDKLKDFDL